MKKLITLLMATIMMFALATSAWAADTWDGTSDTTWYNDTDTSFEISTAEQLAGLAAIVNGTAEGIATDTFSGKTITLTDDLDLNSLEWTPIGTSGKPFGGTFDGSEKTISNLKIEQESGTNYGLFGYASAVNGKAAALKNVNIHNVDIDVATLGYAYVGSLVGNSYTASVTNCHVTGLITIDAYWFVGGLAGHGYSTVSNCSVSGEAGSYVNGDIDPDGSNNHGVWIGGLWGQHGEGSITVDSCSVSGLDVIGGWGIGGVTGYGHYGNTYSNCTVENVNVVCVTTNTYVGSIAGGISSNSGKNPLKILDCTATNTVCTINGTEVVQQAPYSIMDVGFVVGNNVTFDDNNLVTGGTFDVITEDMIATDYMIVDNEDGTYSVSIDVSNFDAKMGDDYYTTIQSAINAVYNTNVETETEFVIEILAGTYTDSITITQEANKNITIQPAEDAEVIFNVSSGIAITIAKNESYTPAYKTVDDTLLIKNIDFVSTLETSAGLITAANGSCAHNVTVEGCSFTCSSNSVGYAFLGSYGHSSWNITFKDCTASSLHTFVYSTGNWNSALMGITLDGCEINAVAINGENIYGIHVDGCTINSNSEYAIRNNSILSYSVMEEDNQFLIENSTLTVAAYEADKGVITLRHSVNTSTSDSSIDVTEIEIYNCAILPYSDEENNGYAIYNTQSFDNTIIATNNYWGTDTPDFTSLVNDAATNNTYYPYYTDADMTDLYAPVTVTSTENVVSYYGTLAAAVAAAAEGDTVTLLEDVTVSETITIPYGKDLIIDGDGHKITSTIDATGNAAGVFAVATDTTSTDGYRVIKSEFYDITFELCSKAPAISTGWYYYTVADLTVDGCTFLQADDSTVQWAIHSTSIGNLTLTNNVFDGNFTKALCFYSYLNESGSDWTINIKNNTFTGPEDTNTAAVMTLNLAREAVAGTVVNITGNTFENQKKVLSVDSCSVTGKLNLSGNKFINCLYGFDLSTDTDDSSDNDGTGNNMLEINTGYNLAYNYFVDGEGTVSYVKVLDSNSAVDGEYVYENNDTLSKLVFYPYYSDSTMTTLVYKPTEDGEEVTKDVVDVAKDTLTDDSASTEEKVDLVVTLDKDVIAEDTTLVDLVNELDEELVTGNDSLSTGVSITTLSTSAADAALNDVSEYVEIDASDLQVSEDADANVQGLALAVVGNDEIAEGTSVTVTLEIAQTAAEVTVVTETDDETGEEVVVSTTIAVTYDISPTKTVTDDNDSDKVISTGTVANDDISAPITFTLHLPSIFDTTNRATVTHKDGDDIYSTDTYVVYHDGDDSYITVTTTHFSEFVVELADSVSTGSSVKKYSNSLEVGDNGSAYATPLSAASGTTVYINVTPDTGYEVDEVLVDGGDITVTDNEDGTYSYKQPAYAVEIEVTFVATDDVEEEVVEEESDEALTDFEDVVAGAWYEEYIAAAVEEGIMQGNSTTEFAPNGTTTRAMMIQVLFNLEDQPETENDESAWYSEALAWGVEFGITDGTDITGNLTREQLVTMLYRYAMSNGVDVSIGEDTNILSYNDALDVADWAMDAFQWACGEGIINGDTAGNLNPDGNATRAELAKIMVSYLGL